MNQTKVLFVDDDVATREALVEALVASGYQVDSAGSAAEGLGFLRAGRYQLVITDFSMPGSTGTAMLEQAADEGLMEGSKALLITAYQPENPFNVEVFRKPIDLHTFLRRVEQILGKESRPKENQLASAVTAATFFVDSDVSDQLDESSRRAMAAKVQELRGRGTTFYGWSVKGPLFAQTFAESLGIAHCFQAFLPKPTALISSTPIAGWKVAEHALSEVAGLSVESLLQR
jgi:CheY-like chemotaxis protein